MPAGIFSRVEILGCFITCIYLTEVKLRNCVISPAIKNTGLSANDKYRTLLASNDLQMQKDIRVVLPGDY
jgi:hypothetical protein